VPREGKKCRHAKVFRKESCLGQAIDEALVRRASFTSHCIVRNYASGLYMSLVLAMPDCGLYWYPWLTVPRALPTVEYEYVRCRSRQNVVLPCQGAMKCLEPNLEQSQGTLLGMLAWIGTRLVTQEVARL
jgi:hypothetical protein